MAAAAALTFVRSSALGQQFYVWPNLPKERERMEHHPSIAFFQRRRRNQTQIAISPIQQLPGTSEMEREQSWRDGLSEHTPRTD